MILWPVPQDLDEDISMLLSAEHKEKEIYKYDIIKLTFRNRHNGQQAKAIQLYSRKTEEADNMTDKEAEEWLLKNIWSNPIMRATPLGETLYQNAKKELEQESPVGMNH
jgi:hypothetical protein